MYFILYYFVFNNRYFLIRNLSTYLIFSQMQSEFYFEMRGAFLWVFKWTQLLITLWWLHAYVTYCTLQWDTFVCPKICLKVRAKKKKQTGLILVTTTLKRMQTICRKHTSVVLQKYCFNINYSQNICDYLLCWTSTTAEKALRND